jgi:hypothetical protein
LSHVYFASTATLAATPLNGAVDHAEAIACPGAPTWSVLIVREWADPVARAQFEALPNVTEHYPESFGLPAPPALVTAFAPWGALTGDTIRQVVQKIRLRWPARHLP